MVSLLLATILALTATLAHSVLLYGILMELTAVHFSVWQ